MPPDPIVVWSLVISIATFAVGTVVSVVIYRLGRRLDFRSRMRRWDELRETLNSLFIERRDELHDVILMNARRYEKDYDGGNTANRYGYVMCKGELLGPRHNGIELICGVRETWINSSGRRTLHKPGKKSAGWSRDSNVLEVGLVPWEYIEHINLQGDEYRNEVIFYVQYKGPGRQPFRSYTYAEGEGRHVGPSGRLYFEPLDELGKYRPNRLVAWIDFQKARRRSRVLNRASHRRLKDLGMPSN